jgi:trehalose 6-phosphate phosphatase
VEPDDVIAFAADHLPGLLLALDFDGTLAPLQVDPEQSRPVPGTIDALIELTASGAQVAVITGRDAATVVRLGGLDAIPGIEVEGLYGLERWRDGRVESPPQPEAITQLRVDLPAWLQGLDPSGEVWIEDKGLSLVLHARRAQDPAAAQDRLREPARDLAEHLGLELHDGRDVLEFRIAGYDKGGALRRLVDLFEPSAVVFAGDDLGDLPAFAAARDLRCPARTLAVIPSQEPDAVPKVRAAADVVVPGPAAMTAVLRQILART